MPKDGKRMRPVRIFGILAVRELLFCLGYRSIGSLMLALKCKFTPQKMFYKIGLKMEKVKKFLSKRRKIGFMLISKSKLNFQLKFEKKI